MREKSSNLKQRRTMITFVSYLDTHTQNNNKIKTLFKMSPNFKFDLFLFLVVVVVAIFIKQFETKKSLYVLSLVYKYMLRPTRRYELKTLFFVLK